MGKPAWMPLADWQKVVSYANTYGTLPELLAAIGWHETDWGQLGWGRYGFTLGVGCYSATKANYAFQGLDAQLKWAAPRLGQYVGKSVTRERLINFARDVWKPGNPEAWGKSVYSIFLELGGKAVQQTPDLPSQSTSDINISVEKELSSIEKSVGNIRDILKSWTARNQK
jgi:hypothetical protein